ncbi:YraN family protein [Paraferrimonas haliotis]|uniref:YraN family protein n=1 Tax=Paraferrimonas haliotis TaxID=2013866 RepID=UPI000BA8E5A4
MGRGRRAEQLARQHLEANGLTFVAANVRFPFGELDLIMRSQHMWVFVEVKYRKNDQFGGALQAISSQQQRRLVNAANAYMQRHGIDAPARFDLVAIEHEQLDWIENIFG